MKWLLFIVMLASACSSETAILVEIVSTFEVPAEVDQLDIAAVGSRSGGMLSESHVLGTPFPHSFAIRPKDDDSEEVTIDVVLRNGGALVAERSVATQFVPGEVRTIRVLFGSSDAGTDAAMDSAVDAPPDTGFDSGPDRTFACGAGLSCTAGTEICCHDRGTGVGTCGAVGSACSLQPIECADSADCGGGAAVCCARFQSMSGLVQDALCQPTAVACDGPGSQIFQILCDPAAVTPCPSGLACTGTPTYTGLGWRFCE